MNGPRHSRYILVFLVLVAATLLIPACAARRPVDVGFVATLSGPRSGMGIEEKNGVILAVEAVNAAGGIRGRPIRMHYADDQNDPEIARAVVSNYIDEGVEAIVGHMISGMTLATVNLAEEAGVVMVSPTSSTSGLTGRDDHFFRVTVSLEQNAAIMAAYAHDDLGLDRIAAIYDRTNVGYARQWAEAMDRSFRGLGGQGLDFYAFVGGSVSEYPQAAVLALSGNPDAVVFVSGPIDTALIAQQIRKTDSRIPLLASSWSKTADLYTYGGSAVEGMAFSELFSPESRDEDFLDFRNRFLDRFGYEPNFAGAQAYEAVLYLAEGLRRQAEGPRRGTLRDAMASIRELKGTQGIIRFDEFGDAYRQYYILEIRDGRFSYVEAP